jgi:ectoine hydroxylase-related dioxygenase (phytanoyl-CoA dioxygenase family)
MSIRSLEADGFSLLPRAFSNERVRELIEAVEVHRSGTYEAGRAGLRDVAHTVEAVRALQRDKLLVDTASTVLGGMAFVVRTLFFDKTPGANWKVAWHQDLTICVRERRDVAGFGPWSVKDGIVHVQPPPELLARMITLRLHLDACSVENGALRVLPGSHNAGRLNQNAIQDYRARIQEVPCELEAGGILLMRPLLLHASAPASSPRHRRILHFEFAAEPLPGGLEWLSQTLGM